ncbi:metal ABC transporter substrate-binding protein [Yoonia sp. BS5-3]|uniref:High-affinity zinc uptake system protein ZnuA n=1 Tax=Yoonia phaeophyticola TaxID=3137369 RepID=A0ABZ2V5G7_9RHOB
MAAPKSLFAFVLLVCSTLSAAAQDRARVVAVNYPLQYFAERLLGDTADVLFPVPADVDPSFWRPGIADISLIQEADLILLNGAGFATWIDRVSLPRSRVVQTSAAIEDQFIVTESITHSHGDGGEHSHEGLAAYTWLDPVLAIAQAEAVAAAINARGIAPQAEVNDRLDALRADLEMLDETATVALEGANTVPMIATHPRYQYFAHRYDLSISALEWEAGAAPSDTELADLETLVAKTGAKIILWEAEPPAAAIDAATALGLQSVIFPPMAQSDGNGTYLEALTTSIEALSAAVTP